MMTDYTGQGQMHHHHERDTLSRVIWASILIFAGLIFLADQLGYLPNIPEAGVWSWIMLGTGGLMLLEGIIRALSVDHSEPNLFGLIGGVVLLGIGASAIFGLNLSQNWWPVILIILGISALARGIRR